VASDAFETARSGFLNFLANSDLRQFEIGEIWKELKKNEPYLSFLAQTV
jgi:hypothetical protein